MKSIFLSGLLMGLFVCAAAAQTQFRATLDGADEVPPVTTKAGGWGTFVLNGDKTVTYFINNQGLSATAAHIHEGNLGEDGPIIFTLEGGPDIFSGTTTPFSDDQIAKLRNSGLYANVHTAAFPDGEVRGQIAMRPILFGAHLTGLQVVPPVTTVTLGEAELTVNANRSLDYSVSVDCGGGTAALIRSGPVGQNGPVLFTLQGGPSNWSGTTTVLTTDDLNHLQDLSLYVEIQTLAHPEGEVRGQIVPSFARYGSGCPSSTGGIPNLFGLGASTPGGSVTVKVNNGLTLGSGILAQSPSPDALEVSGCGFYLSPASLVFISVRLSALGELKATVTMPEMDSFDLYLQFFGLDAAAPYGFYSSNALYMPFTKL